MEECAAWGEMEDGAEWGSSLGCIWVERPGAKQVLNAIIQASL